MSANGDPATERPESTEAGPLAMRRSADRIGIDRIEFFSDAVFAIAMTLLVVTLVIPESVQAAGLGDALDGCPTGCSRSCSASS
jgi:Endosomal/lysosomal potassium channel TMEM175